ESAPVSFLPLPRGVRTVSIIQASPIAGNSFAREVDVLVASEPVGEVESTKLARAFQPILPAQAHASRPRMARRLREAALTRIPVRARRSVPRGPARGRCGGARGGSPLRSVSC